MDKNAIKKYATWARRELISRVAQRAAIYEITKDHISDPKADVLNDKVLTFAEKKERKALIEEINKKGYEEVIEEVAYTWFNRFCALRFMEVNAYLPSYVRVFTDEENQFHPQILTEAIHLEIEGLDQEKVYELKEANEEEALYKYLIITQCNALNAILPKMFQKIDDYTELLFPDYLLREGSVIEQMITMIPEEDWMDQVQIIGWLYQYYNSEKKDEVFAALDKKVKITKENIPAATQLFTPDWIVRYMVENSLGHLWLEGHPDEELKRQWKYYLEEASQKSNLEGQLREIQKKYEMINLEEIKCIDPCCGSGHILSYLFDVLIQIYKTQGISTRDAVKSIIEHNLYGLDIDERAAQLSYFSIMMKGRQYDRRFFRRCVQPNIYVIVESNDMSEHALEYFCNGDTKLRLAMDMIISELHDATEYGSILNVTEQDWTILENKFKEIENDISIYRSVIFERLKPMVDVAKVLAQKYHVVVTNPPYMVMSNANSKLKSFVNANYPDEKADLFSCFIEKGNNMLVPGGFNSMVTMQSWMFLASFSKMRNKLLRRMTITNLMHMDNMVMGIAFGTAVTIFKNCLIAGYKGNYHHIKFEDIRNDAPVEFPIKKNRFKQVDAEGFLRMPNVPIAYWTSDKMIKLFEKKKLKNKFISGGRNKTHNDGKYLRMLWEVPRSEKWKLYAKGGAYRKWYGDIEYLVEWTDLAKTEYASHGGLVNERFWDKEGITWTIVTSYKASFRLKQIPVIYSSVSPTIFDDSYKVNKFVLGLLNSKVSEALLNAMNPTLATNVSDILGIPFIQENISEVEKRVKENIELSKKDWDSFETSWDFQQHPLVKLRLSGAYAWGDELPVLRIPSAYKAWEIECDTRFNRLKQNEEELNRIFIDIYGLQEELTPEVEDKDITVRKADLGRDIRSFISYAVGCMFGRYSIDQEGLIYAGGEWNPEQYKTFPADKDNIIPICDDEYFEDDIVGLFVQFVKTVYGEETLEENLKFIADALGGKGSPKEVIRNYFIKDFYKDHCKIYQKRPIYWLFDSGKKNGFKALIYMHRYQPDTIARIRTDYVHQQQSRYRTSLEDLERRLEDADTRERVKLNKKLKTLKSQMDEIHEYEEKIHHLADQMISIDLDDGVKKNYAKFQEVLAKIK